jgi:hypothetical protein
MMLAEIGRNWAAAGLLAAGFTIAATPALAESYTSLQKQGYKTGKMSRSASGAQGWVVTHGEKKFFCKLKASMAYVGSSGLVSILSNGRQIKLDRKTFDAGIGGPDPDIPQLADLKSGRPGARDVGSCSPQK